MNSIKLQSSTLLQITEATNQLTRTAATLTTERCYQLAVVLRSLADKVSFEDVQIASRQLIQSTSNVLTVGKYGFDQQKISRRDLGNQWTIAKSNDCPRFGPLSSQCKADRL